MDTKQATSPAKEVFAEVIAAAGSATELQRALGEAHLSAVINWRSRGIPADKAKAIEALTGISVKRLRPDDWHKYWPDPVCKPARITAKRRAAATGGS